MGTISESFKFGFGAGAGASAAFKLVDYVAGPTQDELLKSRDRQDELAYQRERESNELAERERDRVSRRESHERDLEFSERQNEKDREHDWEIQESRNEANRAIARMESRAREYAADQARAAVEDTNQTNKEIAKEEIRIRNIHHKQRLSHEEELVRRQINAQLNIAHQTQELEKYLSQQKISSDKEIARFQMLADRETQIIMARENAAITLQDRFVQEALKTFPLNVSPIVLLRNRPHTLGRLLDFSNSNSSKVKIEEVYEEVRNYASRPEALNIFIAPVHVDSKVQNRGQLSEQLWDSVYQNLEIFFNEFFNRSSSSPVILYPNAWQKESIAGTHACETLYYFLKDMPCLVLEPRFDGNRFSIVVSAWGLGYESNNHIRSNIEFDFNIDEVLATAAYHRSKRSLELLEKLNDSLDARLVVIREQLMQNVEYYETLDMSNAGEEKLRSINALGVYRLFNIEPIQDLQEVSDGITQLMSIVLAILADIHHLKSTDADIIFPKIFQDRFPYLFADKKFCNKVFRWYESVYVRLRNHDKRYLSDSGKKDMMRIREAQIRNLAFILELIDEQSLSSEIDNEIIDYVKEHYGFESPDIEEVWWKGIDSMTVKDIDFFKELKDRLPRSDKRRRRIINRISDLE